MIKNFAYFGAFTLFVVIVWIVVSIISSFSSTNITGNIEKQIKPLEKSFNLNALKELNEREKVQVDLSELPPEPTVNPVVNQVSQVNILISPTSPVVPPNNATSSSEFNVDQENL